MKFWLVLQLPVAILTVGVWYIYYSMSKRDERSASVAQWLLLVAVYFAVAIANMTQYSVWSWAIFLIGHLLVVCWIFNITARKMVDLVVGVAGIKLAADGIAVLTVTYFWVGEGTQQLMQTATASLYFLMILSVALVLWQKHLERKEAGERDRYRMALEERHNEIQLWMHDLKNHISCIHGLLEIRDYEGAMNYVKSMDDKLQQVAIQKFTDHTIVNILMTEIKQRAEADGVEFEYYTDGVALSFAESADICAILGNLLDNALESSRQSEDKVIHLDIYGNSEREVVIQVSNSCNQAPIVKASQLQSTKHDGKAHGFGLKSVENAAKRYGGHLQISYDDAEKTFKAIVVLQSPDEQQSLEAEIQPVEVNG